MRKVLVLLLCFSLFGCLQTKDETPEQKEANTIVLTDELSAVKEEFLKMDEDDQDSVYMQIAGAALYIKNSKSLGKTSDFDPILGRVQSSLGWDRGKNPDFTDALEKYLISQGYTEPRELNTDKDREWFLNIFNSLYIALKYEQR
jgi:hypothetical protein